MDREGWGMLGTETSGSDAAETYLARFSRRMGSHQFDIERQELLQSGAGHSSFPFVSSSVLVVLLSLLALSIHLGGWSWSSWTYTFALTICAPLAAAESMRGAVVKGWASVLLFSTVVIDAGMPQFFGYSASDLSMYDISAHFLAALVLTLFLWSFVWWARFSDGPPKSGGSRMLLAVVGVVVIAAIAFELLEFATDGLFGWSNFYAGVDTAGDVIFGIAGTVTGGILVARHGVRVLDRPFWSSGKK